MGLILTSIDVIFCLFLKSSGTLCKPGLAKKPPGLFLSSTHRAKGSAAVGNKAPLQAAQPGCAHGGECWAAEGTRWTLLLAPSQRKEQLQEELASKRSSVSALQAVGQEASSPQATWKVGKSLCKVSLESIGTDRGDPSCLPTLKLSRFPTCTSSSRSRTAMQPFPRFVPGAHGRLWSLILVPCALVFELPKVTVTSQEQGVSLRPGVTTKADAGSGEVLASG